MQALFTITNTLLKQIKILKLSTVLFYSIFFLLTDTGVRGKSTLWAGV